MTQMRNALEMFVRTGTKGTFLVHGVRVGYAACRTRPLFSLAWCGHEELNTLNFWAGRDGPAWRKGSDTGEALPRQAVRIAPVAYVRRRP